MLSNEILNKLEKEQELTIEEISVVLSEIILITRENLKKVPIGDSKKCVEANKELYCICNKFNIIYLPLDTRELNNESLFHKFGLIIFNCNNNPIIYLADLTYNQFEIEPEYKDNSPFKYMNKEYYQQLKESGSLPFTEEIFNNYIMSFVMANKEPNNKFYNSIYDELKRFGIKFNSQEIYKKEQNINKNSIK